jgi:diguanylate cyclase (GGDEF)-like protein
MTEHLFRAAFAAAAEAILVLHPDECSGDFDADIVIANPAAHDLVACPQGSLAGRRLSEVWPAASLRPLRRLAGRVREEASAQRGDLRWKRDGAEVHIVATASRVGDHLLLVATDVAELIAARDEIERQRREFAAVGKVMATHAAHLADAAAAAETARAALLEEIARREELERELQRLARTDALTGVLNRHGLAAEAARLVAAARRHGAPLALVIVDADHFKAINDTHGHAAGDAALAHLASYLVDGTRRGIDAVGRLGGEEFVVLMPNMTLAAAGDVAERLRAGLDASPVVALGGAALTASFGVAALDGGDEGFADLLGEADAALYRAKRSGRNKVARAGPETASAA